MPGSEFRALLQALAAAAGPNPVGLTIGERITEPNLHVFGPVITASRTMRDALTHCMALCQALRFAPNGRLELDENEARYVVAETGFGAVWEDIMIALCFHAAVRFLESAHASPDGRAGAFAVYFARPLPDNIADYQRCFRGCVRFGMSFTGLSFPSSLLDLPRPGADAALAAELREVGVRRLQPLQTEHTWSARIEGALRQLGDLSKVDFQRIAAHWGLSLRTLRRRLAVEGTSPAEVLERVRFDRARYYLQETNASIAQVAAILGYSEPTSFRRAFKRWSGSSPSAHRVDHAELAPE